MDRLFTKDATGIAPDGRLFAGDLNALQDAVAALDDLDQNFGAGTIAIADSGLLLVKYGTAEARITGALRVDGILRGLNGIIPGTYTTIERNAIASGKAPFGVAILNSTTGMWEWNHGTDGARDWKPFGFDPAADLTMLGGASSLDFTSQTANNWFLTAKRAADTATRIGLREDGRMEWGPGGVTAHDTYLERSSAGVLSINGEEIITTANPYVSIECGTELPASPIDNQQFCLVDNVETPTWALGFRWCPEITDDSKWLYTGGTPITKRDTGDRVNAAATNSTWYDMATALEVTVPVDGVYNVGIDGLAYSSGGGVASMGFKVGAAATLSEDRASVQIGSAATSTDPVSVCKDRLLKTLTAGTILHVQHRATNNAANSHWVQRRITLTPVRVG